MPNHIKNRIELSGSPKKVQQLIEAFSTHYERRPRLAYDGRQIFTNKTTGAYGWLNAETGEFEMSNNKSVNIVPDGFEQEFDEAWTRFPDFNKIVPMPPGLEANPHTGIDIWVKICTGQVNFSVASNMNSIQSAISSLEQMSAMRALKEGKSVNDFTEEELEIFFQCIRNYRKYGSISWYEWSNKYWGTKWNAYDCEKICDNVFEFDTAWAGVPELIEKMSLLFPDVTIEYKYADEDTGSNTGSIIYKNGTHQEYYPENGSKEAYDLAFDLRPDRKENYKLVGDTYEYVDDEN